MKFIIFYLLTFLAAYIGGLGYLLIDKPELLDGLRVGITCIVTGGIGGCLYCLRGVYLNAAVRNQWSPQWHVWYFLRPIVSAGCGGVSCLFLKAGLLVLESGTKPDASELGFYALAFIAGFNVDKFIKKLEDVAEAVWGIEKSRTTENADTRKAKT
jgi:hypothetical protein